MKVKVPPGRARADVDIMRICDEVCAEGRGGVQIHDTGRVRRIMGFENLSTRVDALFANLWAQEDRRPEFLRILLSGLVVRSCDTSLK
ncbi:MAG: hypothetical protein KGL97_07135, partial [Alphaproteobacteria bacterium]|nr:hypothetical protein [Alphaproteobacteria bacterium]